MLAIRKQFRELTTLAATLALAIAGCAADAEDVGSVQSAESACPAVTPIPEPSPTSSPPPVMPPSACTPNLVADGEAVLNRAYTTLFYEMKCRGVPARGVEGGAACPSMGDAVFKSLAAVMPRGWQCKLEHRDNPLLDHYAVVCSTMPPLPAKEVLYDYWSDTAATPTLGRSPSSFRLQFYRALGSSPAVSTRCDGYGTNSVANLDPYEFVTYGVPHVVGLVGPSGASLSQIPQNSVVVATIRTAGINVLTGRLFATNVRLGSPGAPPLQVVVKRVTAAGEAPAPEILLPVSELIGQAGSTLVYTYSVYFDRNLFTATPGTYTLAFDNCYSRKHPVRFTVKAAPVRVETFACDCADNRWSPIGGTYWTNGDRKLPEFPQGENPADWHIVYAGAYAGAVTCRSYLDHEGGGCNCTGSLGYLVPGIGYSGTASNCVCVPPRDMSYVCPGFP